ncbi:MAG: hypothetical protein JRN54_11245, partial [Nitrososphaerota archaeon]|nr:hypothetical protein [Nitrososphaerota archaeon]
MEDSYSQSVAQGNGIFASTGASALEQVFCRALEDAESEWANVFDLDYAAIYEVQRFLRTVATILAKRSVGVRVGHHSCEASLREY